MTKLDISNAQILILGNMGWITSGSTVTDIIHQMTLSSANEQYCKTMQMNTYSESSALSLTKTQN